MHALAWSLATGAAVTLSWWGVHTVLAGTAYDPPRALPLPAVATGGEDQRASSTHRPSPPPSSPPTPSPVPSAPATPEPSRDGTGARTPSPVLPSSAAPPPSPTTAPPSRAQGYTVDGGRVTFDLGRSSAELVSATPASGWRMQVWKQPSWIRVTFTRDGREQSVFCVWHDTAPRVQIEDRRA